MLLAQFTPPLSQPATRAGVPSAHRECEQLAGAVMMLGSEVTPQHCGKSAQTVSTQSPATGTPSKPTSQTLCPVPTPALSGG